MKKLFLLPLLFILVIPANAQKATEKDNVIKLIKQFDTAIAKKDSLTLSKILDDDFIGSFPNGQSFNKKTCITYHCSLLSKVRELKDEPPTGWNIKISNDCAIINRIVTTPRPDKSGNYRFSMIVRYFPQILTITKYRILPIEVDIYHTPEPD